MGKKPDGSYAIETLGDLRESRHDLGAYCGGEGCGRDLDLNLAKLIELFGEDARYIDDRPSWRIVCRGCGSRHINWSLKPDYELIINNGVRPAKSRGYITPQG